MTRVDPAAYGWLSGSEFEVAGCVTIVPAAGVGEVAESFGHDRSGDPARADELGTFGALSTEGALGLSNDQIWLAVLPEATLVFESNGYQGSRDEVLHEVSRVGASKIAASLFWNVNGMTVVTCARRGKVVASIDLSYVEEDDLADMPRVLRPLARLCIGDDDADLLAIGAAMLQTYTGVGFTREHVDAATARRIIPLPSALRTYTRGHPSEIDSHFTDLSTTVENIDDADLRSLAEWCATAAVREAGLLSEAAVQQVIGQFGSGAPTSLSPGLDALRRRFDAESQRLQAAAEKFYDEDSFDSLALNHAYLPGNALTSLYCTSHSDPYSAAIGALSGAASTFASTRLERGVHFIHNSSGRRRGHYDASPRHEQFVQVARQVIEADPGQWPGLAEQLPEPLPAEELAAAVDVDRRLQEAGAFSTWQVSRPSEMHTNMDADMEVAPFEEFDRDAAVRERYLALEERDRAIAAHGPIVAGALDPENPGGFAVAFADGLRVERLPVGRAAGKIYFTFVFTHEFGFDHHSRGRGSRPDDRISYHGPEGPLNLWGGGGSGNETTHTWHTQFETTGLSWIQLKYRENNITIATEKIELD